MDYELRTARPEDVEELDRLYTLNMRPHVLRLGVWDPHVFRQSFVPEHFMVVEVGGQVAGMVKVVEDESSVYIAEIQVAGPYQGSGLGRGLLERIQRRAAGINKPVWLKVLRKNPARRLYERMGFRVFEDTPFHHKMSWHPPARRIEARPVEEEFALPAKTA